MILVGIGPFQFNYRENSVVFTFHSNSLCVKMFFRRIVENGIVWSYWFSVLTLVSCAYIVSRKIQIPLTK